MGSEEMDSRVAAVLERLGDLPGALLPVLHEIQHELGHVPAAAVPAIARALHLSRAEVQGVLGFYTHFRTAPAGEHVLQLCRAEACQAVGCRDLEAHVKARLGIDYGATTADGRFTLEPVYCLGNCACGPSLQIDDRLHARVTPQAFDALLASLEGGR
ncbi:MAG: formate dehydrogenase subunit gamma [Pseudomonadota bacterium]|jgi:formate dehydrogenase subunit gamma